MEIVKRGCARCGKQTRDTADAALFLSHQDYRFYKTLPQGHSGEQWVFGKDCYKAILENYGRRDW